MLTLTCDSTVPLRRCEHCQIVLRGQWWWNGLRVLCAKCAVRDAGGACEDSGARSKNGSCVVHDGDACLLTAEGLAGALAGARSANSGWQEEARRYAQNADYWRGKAEQALTERGAAEQEVARLTARIRELEAERER